MCNEYSQQQQLNNPNISNHKLYSFQLWVQGNLLLGISIGEFHNSIHNRLDRRFGSIDYSSEMIHKLHFMCIMSMQLDSLCMRYIQGHKGYKFLQLAINNRLMDNHMHGFNSSRCSQMDNWFYNIGNLNRKTHSIHYQYRINSKWLNSGKMSIQDHIICICMWKELHTVQLDKYYHIIQIRSSNNMGNYKPSIQLNYRIYNNSEYIWLTIALPE